MFEQDKQLETPLSKYPLLHLKFKLIGFVIYNNKIYYLIIKKKKLQTLRSYCSKISLTSYTINIRQYAGCTLIRTL